jgi:hypothetical protein
MVSVVIEPYEPLVYKAIQKIEQSDPSYFQGVEKIVLEHGDPGHFGKVQNDQVNTIYISIQKIKGALSGADEDEIVNHVAEILAHEMGHLKSNFQGGEAPAEKEEDAMRNQLRKEMSAARYSHKLTKTAFIKPVATPTELADSVLRIVYHFAQKVNPEKQREYLHNVAERMRSLSASEIAEMQKNPGGGIGAAVSLTKNILAGQSLETATSAIALIQQRIEQL